MLLRKLVRTLGFLPLLTMLALAGCGSEDQEAAERQKRIHALLEEGKDLLARNQWGHASETFRYVLENIDPLNSQARFGIVLADVLSFTDTIRLVSSLGAGLSPSSDENQFVNQLITDIIHDLRGKFEKIDRNLFLVQADPGFMFRIKDLPIYLDSSGDPSMNLAGEWDRADAFLLNAPIRGILGVLNFLDSVDLRLDVLRVYDYFSQVGFSTSNTGHIQSAIVYILNDPAYPDFLSVKAEGGNELAKTAGLQFGEAIKLFQTALFLASRETDVQSFDEKTTAELLDELAAAGVDLREVTRSENGDFIPDWYDRLNAKQQAIVNQILNTDILQYVDLNENGRYDPELDIYEDRCAARDRLMAEPTKRPIDLGPEPFSIFGTQLGNTSDQPYSSEQSACLFQKLRSNLLWDDIANPPSGLREIDQKQLESLGRIYPARPRINFLKDMLPLVASIASSAIKNLDLSSDVQSLLGLATPGLITNLVTDILGDSLEFDLYAFFDAGSKKRAGNIRDLLPAWQRGACNTKEECLIEQNIFIMELECAATVGEIPLAVTDQFLCKSGWAHADTQHFASEVTSLAHFKMSPLEADGIESYLPYIALQDASFHGLLYLNLSGLAVTFDGGKQDIADNLRTLGGSSGFKAATLMNFNAFLAGLSNNSDIKSFLID
jgi:hypothetical protein